jgi:stage III sporulation protein AG
MGGGNGLNNFFKSIGQEKILLLLLAGIAMIAFSYPMENLIKQTSNSKVSTIEESQTQTNTDEQRLAQILSKTEGIGKVEVMVTTNQESSEIEGVLVLATGADDTTIKTQIYETVQALFGVPLHKIKVLKGDF